MVREHTAFWSQPRKPVENLDRARVRVRVRVGQAASGERFSVRGHRRADRWPGTAGRPRGAHTESGRTMARTGLRMMPTFPSFPLKFRTAVLPSTASRLACQTRPSRVAPHDRVTWLLPSFAPPAAGRVARSESRPSARYDATIRADNSALPQGPSLRSGLFCPDPSTLNRPHPPHSWARRDFPARQVIRAVFAVPTGLGDPRLVPCFRCTALSQHAVLCDPGKLVDCAPSPFVDDSGLRLFVKGSALPKFPSSASDGVFFSRLL
jgi:hypothetical protein